MGLIEKNAEPKEGVKDVRIDPPPVVTGEMPGADVKGGDKEEPKGAASVIPGKEDPKDKPEPSETEKKVSSLLESIGAKDLEDLEDILAEANELREKVGDLDIDEILRNQKELSEKLNRLEMDRLKAARENETPEETIARQARELEEIQNRHKQTEKEKKDRQTAIEEAQKAVDTFNSNVKDFLDKEPGLTKDEKDFVALLAGVGNPFNDIRDITNPREVSRMLRKVLKTYGGHREGMIKGYREGKIKLPDITPTGPGAPPDGKIVVKSIKHAGELMRQRFGVDKR